MDEISIEDAIRFQEAAKHEARAQMTALEADSPEGRFVFGCFDKAIAALRPPGAEELHIVFDGPPGPESGRFVECETADGRSIHAGEWRKVGDYWHLVILRSPGAAEMREVADGLRGQLSNEECDSAYWKSKATEAIAAVERWDKLLGPYADELTDPTEAAGEALAHLIRQALFKKDLPLPAPEVPDTKIHAADEWCEEDGDVLWWRFPIVEPPHLGSPLETDWQDDLYTHWTRFAVPEESSWPK